MARSSWAITWSVWRALFLREAMYRLYHRRAAWAWLLFEPVGQVAFLMFIFGILRVSTVGGLDFKVWIMVGMLGFYMFKRTMSIGMAAISMSKPLFVYRQVRPVDVVLVRATSEAALMCVIAIVILFGASLFGVDVWPDNLLGVFFAFFGLGFLGLSVGLVLAVPNTLIPEVGDVVGLIMTPLYMMSGVMFPIAGLPQPYLDWLRLNPIAHSVDFLRQSFVAQYVPFPELSGTYPYIAALGFFLLGLVLLRVYEKRVIQL